MALTSTNREKRRERLFHDHMVVYFVILMGMFLDLPYRFVMEKFAGALSWLQFSADRLASLTESAIVQARQRVGSTPLRSLFHLFARPLATEVTLGASFHGLRLVIIDGTTFIVSDSEENAKQFGRPSNQSGPTGMPQIRCVGLIEYATRVFIDLVFGPYEGSSETSLALSLLSRLQPGMLCMGDRLYPSHEFCKIVVATGAHFCFRVKKDIKLVPTRVLDDGSYEARMYLYIKRKKQKKEYVTVRVVKYNAAGHSEEIRLITSLLDDKMVPATELAQLYPVRWTEETTYNELKSVLRCRDLVLRSQSPELVEQELYGVFLAHYLVRCFMFSAASQGGVPPDALSFNRAIYLVRENLPKLGDFSPGRDTEDDY